jgi:NifU-like protein involved in Fe-S cluster formation
MSPGMVKLQILISSSSCVNKLVEGKTIADWLHHIH